MVGGDGAGVEVAAGAPGVEDEAGLEGLTVGGDDDAIVLTQGGTAGAGEVEVEGAEVQGVEGGEDGFTPLVAEALLADLGVDEEVVEPRQLRGLPLAVELVCTGDGGAGEGGGLERGDGGAEGEELGFKSGRAALELRGAFWLDAAGEDEQRE